MPQGPLALVGGAEWTPGCDFDAELLAASGANEVLVLPTAAAYENPAKVVERATNWFEELGAKARVLEVYSRSEALDSAAVEAAREARFVYLSGGSPMHLRSTLKDTPLWAEIVGAWQSGAVLAAAAESAAVLSTFMVDQRGGAFTVGLGLITTVTVIPRFDGWSKDKAHRTVELAPSGLVVVGLHDRTALIHHEGAWRAAGPGSVDVHVDGRRAGLEALPPTLV